MPAELAQKPQTAPWSSIYPNVAPRVEARQLAQKNAHNSRCKEWSFQVGEQVYAKNF